MNQKIQCLLDGGFITIQDVLEYAQDYMDACDQLDDEQLNKHIYNLNKADYWDGDNSHSE